MDSRISLQFRVVNGLLKCRRFPHPRREQITRASPVLASLVPPSSLPPSSLPPSALCDCPQESAKLVSAVNVNVFRRWPAPLAAFYSWPKEIMENWRRDDGWMDDVSSYLCFAVQAAEFTGREVAE